MFAHMTYTRSYARTLNYNESKVKHGKAAFIHAEGFLIDKGRLTTDDKASCFKRRSDMNTQLKHNTLHAKLLFHPEENFSDNTLSEIADRYMALIGFKDQPYLVYRHDDAGEQHLHIVSSLITESGKRIRLERQPWSMSVQAAQTIEKEYGLRQVSLQQPRPPQVMQPAYVPRIVYGEKNMIQSVEQVLKMITNEYKFTSMEELNALLRPYNIYADRCLPGSHTHQHNGLYYRVLDKHSKNPCKPIKSSDLTGNYGLNQLEKLFFENQASIREMIPFIRSRIDWVLMQAPETFQELDQSLKREGLDLVMGKGEGKYPGIYYVDHQSRCAINTQIMGEDYCAEALFRGFPDLRRQHLPQVPVLLSYLTEQIPVPDGGQIHQQKEIRINKHL